MRIAALDLGSNSFHLIVVEAHADGTFLPLAREKEMLRLGGLVAATGRIGEEAQEAAVATVRRMKHVAEAQGADEFVALGTAALREAADGGQLVDRLADEAGVDVKIIDGVREAQLVFRAIRASVLIEPAPALAADLGGGSLEVMVGDRSGLSFATSLHLGVGRLTAELVESDPPSKKDRSRLTARVASQLEPVMEEIGELGPKLLIGSSGTFVALAKMAVALRDGQAPDVVNQLSVPAEDFAALTKKIFEITAAERAKMPGCDARRAELVPAGAVVLGQLMAMSGLQAMTISEWALREGIVLDAIGQHDRAELLDDPRALRRTSVLSLCRRSNWRQGHAQQVARQAVALFDATVDLHQLGAEDRELLELGALLHDIGEHISRSDHDRHTAYLIENGGLRGFSPDEIRILSVLGRYHLRGTPKASGSDAFAALSADDRRRAVALVALLRVADALDSAHAGLVSGLRRLPTEAGAVHLLAYVHGDAELERWMVRRKGELLEKTFGVELVLQVEAIGRGDFDLAEAEGAGLG